MRMAERNMVSASRLLAALAVVAAGFPSAAAAAVVRFRATAEVTDSVVRLADVAEILEADSGTTAAWGQFVVAPAPAPGGTAVLECAAIRARLLALGMNLAAVDFIGSSRITVRHVPGDAAAICLPAARVSAASADDRQRAEQRLAVAIRTYLRQRDPELGPFDVALQLEPHDVPAVLGSMDERVEVGGGGPPWDAPQVFTVRLQGGPGGPGEIAVRGVIEERPQVVTVRYDVPAGVVLGPADLTLTEVGSTAGVLRRPEEVIGKETTTRLRSGRPIRQHDVQPVALVRAGDIVTVIARQEGVTVRRQMKARNTAALGETVSLTGLDGRQKLAAIVSGPREAEVPPAAGAPAPSGRIQFRPAE